MKEYVRKVGGRGASYKVNKAQRLSEEFSWPEKEPDQSGQDFINIKQKKIVDL